MGLLLMHWSIVAAVTRIFEVKERPRFDPLIVHLPGISWLGQIAEIK